MYSKNWQILLKNNITWQAQWWLNRENLLNIKIPIPPLDIQKQIIEEIEKLEESAKTIVINDIQEQKENILEKYL